MITDEGELLVGKVFVPSIILPAGVTSFEIDTPIQRSGAVITIDRMAWPAGTLFTWRVYERDRNGTMQLLASATEEGGEGFHRDGTPGAPLTIELSWLGDKDKIKVEIDAVKAFTAGITLDWK